MTANDHEPDALTGNKIPEPTNPRRPAWMDRRADALTEGEKMTDHYPVKQVIVIRKDLKMRRGKEIAQGAHASMAFLTKFVRGEIPHLTPAEWEWVNGRFAKITVTVPGVNEMFRLLDEAIDAGVRAELIMDDGKTEFGGVPTVTACAIGPDLVERINPITGHLPLY